MFLASRNIEAGGQIYNTYKDCSEPSVTSDIFRDCGFVAGLSIMDGAARAPPDERGSATFFLIGDSGLPSS